MTAIVGMLCKDGAAIIGTDSSATFMAGNQQIKIIEQTTEKLHILHDRIIVAGTGQVGLGQRFCATIDTAYTKGKLFVGTPERSAIEIAKHLCRAQIDDFASTQAPKGQYGALVAFPTKGRANVCEFALNDFQPEFKTDKMWYGSMGCSQHITDTFLALMREVFWTEGPPNMQDGIFTTVWTLEHAIQVNPGGVKDPIRVAVLQGERARMLSDDDIAEHSECISAAKAHLRRFREQMQKADTPPMPQVPAAQS